MPSVWALGVGAFAIGKGEFVATGMLPEMARELRVTVAEAGHVISAYALGVVLGARKPPMRSVMARFQARRTLGERCRSPLRPRSN